MSLDVYLRMNGATRAGGSGIFVREAGETKEISREDWDHLHPSQEPYFMPQPAEYDDGEVFSANVTHNLNTMAEAAGIYDHLWRPDEIGITKASELIEPLRAGLALLKSDPPRFEQLNPKNGWGSYERFVPWIERYLAACENYPDAAVEASR